MSDSTIEYKFKTSKNQAEYEIGGLMTNWSTITDINNGNYTQGLVTFNGISLSSSESGYVYDLSHAITHIPVTWELSISNGYFTSDNSTTVGNVLPQNINAVTKKGNHHFIHNAWCKLGGVDIMKNSSGYNNLYINEKKKQKSELDKIYDDSEQYYLDSAESYSYLFNDTNAIGEYNNFSERQFVDLDGSSPYLRNFNKAIYERNKHFIDDSANNPYNSLVTPANFGQTFSPYFSNGVSTMTWKDVLISSLSDISDVFSKCPVLMKLNGLEIKLQLNAGSSCSWNVTYANAGTANTTAITKLSTSSNTVQYKISGISSNCGNGQSCPLIISSASNSGLSGLTFTCANGSSPVLTLKCTIGWGAINSAPCRLMIPSHKLNLSYLQKLNNNPIYSFYASSFFLDASLSGYSSSQPVIRTLNSQYYRPRKLYIVPFLSNQNKTTTGGIFMTSPFQSPVSSAPTTCSVCKLKNFNVMIGGMPIFPQEQLFMPSQFFDQNYNFLNANDYSLGNNRANPLKSGRITKSMFQNGAYNVYVVDLKHSITNEDDSTPKQLYVNFNIDAPSSILYDFYLIVECDSKYSVDCINGTMLPNDIINNTT